MAQLKDVVFDCEHPASLARFWAEAISGYRVAPYDQAELERLRAMGVNDPEDDPSVLVEPSSPEHPRLYFQKVPERKEAKNRVHLDLRADDGVTFWTLLSTRGRAVMRRIIAFIAALVCAVGLLVSPAGAEKPNFDDYCEANPDRCDVGGGNGGGRPF